MTIFILLIVGFFFLFVTGILIAIDNRKRKYKKKILPLPFRIAGLGCTLIAVICFVWFAHEMIHFEGEESGKRVIMLRSTMQLTDVEIPSNDAKLNKTMKQKYKDIVKAVGDKKSDLNIEYVDALLNKKKLNMTEIHEIKYSDELDKKQIQIVEYLVNMKDGIFTRPGIYYYLILSDKLSVDKEKVDVTTENVKEKRNRK